MERSGRSKACHECRRPRNSNLLADCSQCCLRFCQTCLHTRHGEDLDEVTRPELQWLCPKCRPGCGAGCEQRCCTCSYCWRVCMKTPPRSLSDGKKMVKAAKSAGFCLHDYLIHLQTHESKEEIMKRNRYQRHTLAMAITKITSLPLDDSCTQEDSRDKTTTAVALDAQVDEEIQQEKADNEQALRDTLTTVFDLPIDIYLLSIWFSREKKLDGNTVTLTLNDRELQQISRIRNRSHLNGIASIFGSTSFKDRDKESLAKSLKDCFRSHLTDCEERIGQFCADVEGMI